MNTISIDIDIEVYEELQRRAKAFVDTPNSVLRRLLFESDEDAPAVGRIYHRSAHAVVDTEATMNPQVQHRASSADLLPASEYTLPILEALMALGGVAGPKAVLEHVGNAIKDRLQPMDLEAPPSGGIRWKSRAHFHRYFLKERGLMENPRRGVWAITDKGRNYVVHNQISEHKEDE